MTSYLRTLQGFNRDTRLVLVMLAAVGFSYFGVQAVLYNLYLLRLGFGADFIGLLGGLGQLTWAACALPAGAVGKRLGLRQAIQAGMIISLISNALFLLSESLPSELRIAWMVVFSLLGWVGSALWTVNSIPYLMAITRPEERNHAFAVQSGLFSLLGFAGSLLAGILPGLLAVRLGVSLESAIPYRWALWLVPPVLLLGLLAVSIARPARLAEVRQAEGEKAASPGGLFALLALVFLLQSASLGVLTFFNVYLDARLGVPTGVIGVMMGFGQFLPFFAALATPLLLARWGAGRSLALSALGGAFFLLPLAAIPHPAVAALGLVGANSMGALLNTARVLFSQEVVAPRWRTTTSAIHTIGLALGWGLIAFTGGQILIPSFGFAGFFLIGAGMGLVSVLLLWGTLRYQSVQAAMSQAGSSPLS